MPSQGVGYTYAVLACIFNGSFLVPFKFPQIAELHVHPFVYQVYASIGIFLSSWTAAAFLPLNPDFVTGGGKGLVFTPYGFLGGVIMVLSMVFSFLSTKKIGVALAQGIFGGLAIVVSYIWALLIFDELPENIVLSIFGVIILVIGIVVIAMSRSISSVIHTKLYPKPQSSKSRRNNNNNNNVDEKEDDETHAQEKTKGVETDQESWNSIELDFMSGGSRNGDDPSARLTAVSGLIKTEDYILGTAYAVLCGILGGTTLVPLYYVDATEAGLAYLPSFGIGVLATTPFVVVGYFYFIEKKPIPSIPLDRGFVAGVLSGVLWNISNILSVGAIPILGYGVAFPLVHSAIFISGLWGIFLFKEFRSYPLAEFVFFLGGIILITGTSLVSVSSD